jgi:sialic acid synthase SpsE
MSCKIKISDTFIGDDEPVYVIADMGVNHDNNLSQAFELIDIGAECGVDAVKLQLYYADGLWPKHSKSYSILKTLETNREWVETLMDRAEKCGVTLLATSFDHDSVDLMDDFSTPVFKWASSEIFDLPLLKYAAQKGKPIILSTGVCDLGDIQKAINVIQEEGNNDIILLHCVSSYPTEPKDVHLRMMDTIKSAFHFPTGFSDHSTGIAIPIAAVARGGCVIEKHYTIDRSLKGPDHGFALEPNDLKKMVEGIRDVEKSLGSPVKIAIPNIEDKVHVVRLFASKDIPKGTLVTEEMITVKRDTYGISPEFYNIVVGREVKVDIKADYPFTWESI